MKTYLVRALSLVGIMGLSSPSSLQAQGVASEHTVPILTGSPSNVKITDSFAPYGARPDTDKIGDDGSAAIRDRNGVIIWSNTAGSAVRIPNSSLAKSLYVSNTECVLYNNRFAKNYNVWDSDSEIVIYRRAENGAVTASPTITLRGTLLDTSIITPNSYGFTIISAYGWNFSTNESSQTVKTGDSTDDKGVRKITYATNKVDQWHNINYEMYRITWDGFAQYVNFSTVDVPKTNTNLGGTTVLGTGDDGSLVLTTIVAYDYYDSADPDDNDLNGAGFFATGQSTLWATWRINAENIFSTTPTLYGTREAAYVSNNRLLLEQDVVDPLTGFPTGDSAIADYRVRSNGLTAFAGRQFLEPGYSMLPVSSYTRGGLPPYVYAIDLTGTQLKLYRFDATLVPLGGTVTLPSPVVSGNDYVRNPFDASLLIRSQGATGLLWIPSALDSATASVIGLGTPKSLPNSTQALPMFVTSKEAVAWMNSEAPVNLAEGGQLPPARIAHFGSTFPASTLLTPPIEGRYVALPSTLSPDPNTEGWYMTTFEKLDSVTARIRNYSLFRPQDTASIDSDGDGLNDALELVYGTNPNSKDTDGDGVSDYDEIFIFFTDPNTPSFSQVSGGGIKFNNPAVSTEYEGIISSPEDGQSFKQSLRLSASGGFSSSLKGLVSNSSFRGRFSGNGKFKGYPGNVAGLTSVEMSMVRQHGGVYFIQGFYDTPTGGKFFFQLRPVVKSYKPASLTFEASLLASTFGPTGSAVATGSVSSNGKISFNVYLPDGSRSSYSGAVVSGNLIAFYTRSNAAGNPVMLGSLKIQNIPGKSDFSGSVKLYSAYDRAGSLFPSGYDQARVLTGSRYVSPAKGTLPIRGFPVDSNNAVFSWIGGDYDGVQKVGTWATNGRMTIPPTPTSSASAKFNSKTGLLQLNYNRLDPFSGLSNTTSRTVGVVVQKNRTFKGSYVSGLSAGDFVIQPNTTGLLPEITSVSPTSKSVRAEQTTYNVSVGSAGVWDVSIPSDANWVTATISSVAGGTGPTSTTSGNGNGTVTIVVALNATNTRREAKIKIAGVTHTITQDFR